METATLFQVDCISLYIFVAKFMFPLFASLNNIYISVYTGVSNLSTREVVEWMGMPVIKMNRYTKSACRCTCIDQYMSAHICFLENNSEDRHAV